MNKPAVPDAFTRGVLVASLICLLVCAGSALAGQPTIVFMSDFGTIDDSVAICKGVMIGIEPDLRIIDITHEVTPFSVSDAARFLAGVISYFGPDTVFVVVVDPGVGSARKPIVAKSRKGHYFVLPDNGLITMVEDADGIESVREIRNEEWMTGRALSSTFHGRDIFAPVAAHIAARKDWTTVGPLSSNHVRLQLKQPQMNEDGISGEIIGLDGPYGNLVTNVSAELFAQLGYKPGQTVSARIKEQQFQIPFVKTFSDVPVNQPLFYIDSRGRLGVAINHGNFASSYSVIPPARLQILRPQE